MKDGNLTAPMAQTRETEMGTQIGKVLFVQIRKTRFQVASLQEASERYCAARDAAFNDGAWGRDLPKAKVVDENGKTIGHISQNGRVWAGSAKTWTVESKPIYDNRVTA